MPEEQNTSKIDGILPAPEEPKEETQSEKAEAFKTPEQAAEQDNTEQHKTAAGHHGSNFDPPKNSKWQKLKGRWQKLNKKQKALVIIVLIILVGAIVCGIVFALKRPAPKPAQLKKPTLTVKPAPTSDLVPSTLTGLPVAPIVNNRPVTGVMIENSDFARPQSGLDQAGVVFEAIAEGGITRFLALYQDTQPNWIGPVRSARPYYVQWCMGFDCALAHVGGSPQALYDIGVWHTKDLNQFYYSSYYQRITARYAPHNVYTSIAALNTLEADRGFGKPNFYGFLRKPDAPAKNPKVTTINFHLSGPDYDVKYVYNPAKNNYSRFEGGAPHMEQRKNGQLVQLAPKVVIGVVMKYSLETDDYHSFYDVVSTGQAYIFQDGKETTGTWIKTQNNSNIRFVDSSGKRIPIDAGQTWITALISPSDVSYN